MKSFIPHRILVINEQVVQEKDEENMTRCYQLAFDWANRMGMKRKRVFDLYLQSPDPNKDPINIHCQSYLWCKIECTMEERKIWDEIQKLNVQHAILTALSGDE